MGEQDNPGDSTDFLLPQIVSTALVGHVPGSLHDHFGVPTAVPGLTHSALPARAYALTYNEWFRSEDLQDSIPFNTDDGPDAFNSVAMQKRGKRHDYFTSCLPFAQKGEAPELSFGGSAPVIIDPADPRATTWTVGGTGDVAPLSQDSSGTPFFVERTETADGDLFVFDSAMIADLSLATGNTINEIRQAFQIQRLLERDARGGTRYTEINRSHFGVVSPDARQQRPEYLGGGSAKIAVNVVAQTAGDTEPGPAGSELGHLAAYVTSSHAGRGFQKSFTEHCTIIGLACIRADLNYQQGLNRMWSRLTRFDFYWPAFSHLGEQSVKNKEIFAQGSDDIDADEETFGFQERYAEYRYKPSEIHHRMRSNDPVSLDTWHLAQDFEALPLLNAEFIEENPPIERIIAVQDEPEWLFDAWFNIKHVRPMPTYSVPGMIDHF